MELERRVGFSDQQKSGMQRYAKTPVELNRYAMVGSRRLELRSFL
jgi:hypothetical protein